MIRAEFFRNRLTGRPATLTALARVLAGVAFLLFGILKFARHDAEVAEFVRYGFTEPGVIVVLVGVLEVVGGLMLVAGLGTRLAALGLAVDMIGAILTAGLAVGGPIHLGLTVVLLVVMLVLLWAGPGAASVDGRLAR